MQPYPIAIHHTTSSSNQEVNDPEVDNLVNDTGHISSIRLQGRVSNFVFLWIFPDYDKISRTTLLEIFIGGLLMLLILVRL